MVLNAFDFIVGLVAFEKCINETAKYCSQRKIFGKSVLDNQVVHYRLSELQTEVELLRSLLYRATGELITSFLHVTESFWTVMIHSVARI